MTEDERKTLNAAIDLVATIVDRYDNHSILEPHVLHVLDTIESFIVDVDAVAAHQWAMDREGA